MKYNSSTTFCLFGLIFSVFFSFTALQAQNSVGIGTREPNTHAALQVVATENNQGVMIPGLTTAQRTAEAFMSQLGTAENGLLVFDTNEQKFYYWMTNGWQPLVSGTITDNLTGGEGIEVVGEDLIVNTGDVDSTDDITTSTQAEGDIGGTFPLLTIEPGAVTTEKLGDGSVTTLKVEDNTLLPEDLASPGAGKVLITTNAGTVFWENQSLFGITFLQQGRVYVGDSGNRPAEVDMRGEGNILVGNGTSAVSVPVSGDVRLGNTGNVQLQPGVVTSAEIADGAVTSSDLAEGSVSATKIQDAAVVGSKIAADAVDASKIVDASVGSAELASGSVGTDEILDNAIIDADISSSAAIAGTKVNPAFGSLNISTTGSLSAGSAAFAAKATSDATLDTDPAETLTTKGYVDAEISAVSQPLTDGDGVADFTYDGTSPTSISIDAGQGLGFDAGQLVVVPGAGLGFDAGNALEISGVTSAQITDESILNADIALTAGIQIGKLESLGNANLIIGDGTTNNAVTISGDATVDAGGQLTLSDDVTTRANLGLGTMATQDASSVNVTGGTIDGTIIGSINPAAGTFTDLTAANLSGDGSGITNLDAANVTSGTLVDARLNDTGPGAGVYGSTPSDYISSIELDDKGRVVAVTAGVPASDQRLKENFQKIESSLPQLLQLKPYQYNWKNHPDAGLSYGLIAQDLVKVFPELVEKRSDGYLGVSYMELIPFLIKAIQEQQEQITILKKELDQAPKTSASTEIQQLKEENFQLRQEIEAIKAALGLQEESAGQE